VPLESTGQGPTHRETVHEVFEQGEGGRRLLTADDRVVAAVDHDPAAAPPDGRSPSPLAQGVEVRARVVLEDDETKMKNSLNIDRRWPGHSRGRGAAQPRSSGGSGHSSSILRPVAGWASASRWA